MSPDRFRHEALLYSGQAGFLEGVLPFLRDGIAAEEPTLVVESTQKIDLLRGALDGGDEFVMFADMAEVGANPARIIPAWKQFVDRFGAGGVPLRGIGEPIWRGRPADELAEAQHHEALLNVAFGNGQPWWLLCPYDLSQMDDAVIEEAKRSHEYVMHDGASTVSPKYLGIDASGAPFGAAMSDPPAEARTVAFDVDTLLPLRAEAARFAMASGATARRVALFVTALNEVATNSVIHGGGSGKVRMWRHGQKIVAEVRDRGSFEHPLADRNAPGMRSGDPRGLWLANQLCDLVQVRSVADGTVFRLHMKIDPERPHLEVIETGAPEES